MGKLISDSFYVILKISKLTSVSSCVALEVKGVVESLSAEGAQVPLDITVTLHVPVEEPLQTEDLGADPTLELGRVRLRPNSGNAVRPHDLRSVGGKRVLDAVSAIDQLYRALRAKANLENVLNYQNGSQQT